MHNFGINIPTSYADCKRLDKENGNNFWIYELKKEMKNVGIAFKILEEDEHLPVGYKKSSGHIIFTVKMDFTHKSRWVSIHITNSYCKFCLSCTLIQLIHKYLRII